MQAYPEKDRVVVVTGAASGIGKAIARHYAQRGAAVGLLDCDTAGLQSCVAEFEHSGYVATAAECDVTSPRACTAAIDAVIARWGGIDVLVNNAGITQRDAFVNTVPDVYRRVMAVNFFGALHCTQAAIRSLVARQGQIIVISSIGGFAPLLGRTGYCASKHALHGFFNSLRAELRAHNVQVLIACPWFVTTNLQRRALAGNGSVTSHPQSRVGRSSTPEDVARAIYRAACKRQSLLVLTPMGRFTYWLSRLAPQLYETIMRRQLRQELIR
jgi:NAD(P)-dependent dehydrogenase (short-subunit alcohol dehydrogenase family)